MERIQHVLVVEDEAEIQELIEYNLKKDGFEVTLAASGEDGLKLSRIKKPDLILLDLMLPEMSGLAVCRELKSDPKTANIPIIIVSAKGEEADIVSGLELGADDYVAKPFSPRILVARARAVLRRKAAMPENLQKDLTIHELSINPSRHEAFVGESPLQLTATEFRILHFLARHPGWVFTRQQIVENVHGSDYPVTERSIDVQIAGLRKKLDISSEYIETVRGIGYRMKEGETSIHEA